ncbi:glutaredoxin 2 [Neisseria sp. Ec49-e6-T10]|uniref:glutaredoxin 2 n=1 Tax=Neisseria sp. Ec49-e6-T10 TaxID=3140744 RepID=UPI003EB77653
MKLYVYDHCPFCVKARMIFGIKKQSVQVHYLLNDDEQTPISMIGQKMTPILEKEDGTFMPESMDIVHYIDQLYPPITLIGATNPQIAQWLEKNGQIINQLRIPRFVKVPLPEFETEASRLYFTEKKEKTMGSFDALIQQTAVLLAQMNQELLVLNEMIQTEHACNGVLSEDDIHLFAALRGLSIVKGVAYPAKVEAYRQAMAKDSNVPLHDHIAI